MIYEEPIIKDMIILIPYFNFTNSIKIKENLLYIIKLLDTAKIPFLIGEVYFETDLPHFPNYFNWSTNSFMFYKENILNLLGSKIDDKYKYVCIMDGDIYFKEPDWYDKIKKELLSCDVCQPFINAIWYNKYYKEYKRSTSILIDRNKGHPGFSWAFRMDWFKKFNLFDLNLIGGGDRSLTNLVLNIDTNVKYIEEPFILFKNKITNVKSTYSNMTICHMYHGNFKNRQYENRENIINNILSKYNLNNILQLVYISKDGLYLWKDEYRDEINKEILAYFISRKDDK